MTRILSLLITLALAGPTLAQDTTETETTETPAVETETSETPAAETEEDAQSSGDSGLTMGTDADSPEEAQIGQPYTKEEFGDWQLQCVRTEDGEDPCQLYQLVEDEEGNPVAEFSLFRLPEGGQAVAGATVVVPLETDLTQDLRLGVDGSKGKRYRYSFCSTVGCFARIGLTSQDVASLKAGGAANLTIVPWAAPDVTVKLNMSLIGFTAGYEEVSVAAAQQR